MEFRKKGAAVFSKSIRFDCNITPLVWGLTPDDN